MNDYILIEIFNLVFCFFFVIRRNACRSQHKDNLQTEIMRNRASQFNEPSSRRGSVGVSIEHLFKIIIIE